MSDLSDDLIMLAMSGFMIPKAFIPHCGDKVRVNPEFVKYWTRCRGCGLPMPAFQDEPSARKLLDAMGSPDTVLAVSRVIASHPDPNQALTLVELTGMTTSIWLDQAGRYEKCRYCCAEYSVDPCPFKDGKGEPFFVLADSSMSMAELKVKNIAPGATHCAKCGTLLRNIGWHAMQHCPRCEP